MFGMLLALVSNAFQELADSVGKYEIHTRAASIYTIGFLSLLFGAILLVAEGLMRHSFVFSFASLPTFVPRLFLEVLQAHVTVRAVATADRSDFGLVRTLTIPLLLIVDVALGYAIAPAQFLGVAIIVLAVTTLVLIERTHMKGFWLLLLTAINAVITISLYKYDITHFNSVEAEQTIVNCVLMVYFFSLAVYVAKENPFGFLRRPLFLLQSLASGSAYVATSFAYLFAPASIITTALRSFSVLFALISGKFYFHEKHMHLKVALFLMVTAGLVLLTVHV
ncbi:hypothetical protein A2851_02395 [Candidatus Kaiserbacteria bacterium RIFCSPHIGHO2_01_FULL_53_29]|uniref:EamA domain-containing protein n=1 Tax=Candidatus Kaiserbacteria bacterium RIFCSPHIGHO2_01_FULL_53_29 TaxID=1798480 RepID=A0A1F6CX25_9BACT|nr:MAG: hypothetical protein A2851_02395 [Candidatus Kaiserbacteria bacterium RIFCSPHIGHO2_01_FULL_53_29]